MVVGVGVQPFIDTEDCFYEELLPERAIQQGCESFEIDPQSSDGYSYTSCLKNLNDTGHFIKEIKSACKSLLYKRRKDK